MPAHVASRCEVTKEMTLGEWGPRAQMAGRAFWAEGGRGYIEEIL